MFSKNIKARKVSSPLLAGCSETSQNRDDGTVSLDGLLIPELGVTFPDLRSLSPAPPKPSASPSPGPGSGSNPLMPAVDAPRAVPAPRLPPARNRLSKHSFSYDKVRAFRPVKTKISDTSGVRPHQPGHPMSARCVQATLPDIREVLEDNQTLRTQINRVGAPMASTWDSLRYDATLKTLAYATPRSKYVADTDFAGPPQYQEDLQR